MVFDAVSAISHSDSMDSAADVCIAAALAGAILAAASGAADW
jgi:hypothetical protein